MNTQAKRSRIQSIARGLIDRKELLYLSSDDVRSAGLFDFERALSAIDAAYRAHAARDTVMPRSDYLKYTGRPSYDRIIPLLGYLGGDVQLSGLKQICSSTHNRGKGLPRSSGLIILNDPETNRPFAVMEGAQISAVRTAAVTGLALAHFWPAEATSAAMIGSGFLARAHLKMWSALYADRDVELLVFDHEPKAALTFAAEVKEAGLRARVVKSAEEAIRTAQIIIPMTTSESPYVEPDWIRDDSLYAAVSLLDAKTTVIEASGSIVVDDLNLCLHEGRPLERLSQEGRLDRERVFEMGDILTGKAAPKSKKRVFFNPMGTVITDIAIAAMVIEEAAAKNLGTRLPV